MPDDIEYLGTSDDNFSTWVYDPNPLGKNAVNQEDLNVWVNFRAFPKSRSVIETDGTYSNSVFSSNGIEFIATTTQNGKGYATTNYTNVGGGNPNEKESFGIKDIQMSYGASLAPTVKITFIDHRGAGLFNEYETVDTNGEKFNTSDYSVFFEQPYPLFELAVKGFYGKAVSYCLHLVKFNPTFDAAEGSFVIEAEFIGYTFAYLTDVILNYVKAINSTSLGLGAIAKQNSKRKATYPNSNDIIPLDDFYTNLGQITRIAEDFKDSSPDVEELRVLNSVFNLLQRFQRNIAKPTENGNIFGNHLPFPQLEVGREQVFIVDVGLIQEVAGDLHSVIVDDLKVFVDEYNTFINKFNINYSYLSTLKIQNFNIDTPAVANSVDNTFIGEINDILFNDKQSLLNETITLDSFLSRTNLDDDTNVRFFIINYFNLRKEINDLLSNVAEKQKELKQVINENLNKALSRQLGFDLKIESVMNILLGNVEAFIDIVYQTAVAADNDNLQSQRISRLINQSTDVNVGDNRIYPFPAVFDVTTGEEIWLGDVVGENNPAFPELFLVKTTMNSLVGVNTPQANFNVNINTSFQQEEGWIPVSPADYEVNDLSKLSSLTFTNGAINEDLANAIVTRALFAYEGTAYLNNSFNIIANLEGAFTASQLNNNLVGDLLKTYDIDDFVEQVIDISGFPNRDNISEIYEYDLEEGEGAIIGGFLDDSDDFINTILTKDKVKLPQDVLTVIDILNDTLENYLIPKSKKDYHRKLENNGLFVKGDVSDYCWNKATLGNLKKLYRDKTSQSLNRRKELPNKVFSILDDLSVFDGKIDKTIDFTNNTNKELKFTNIAREYLGLNRASINKKDEILFDAEYYKLTSDKNKAYLALQTFPLDFIDDFNGIFQLGGIYNFSRLQFAWIASQFYRVKFISDTGEDIFKGIIDNFEANSTLNQQRKRQVIAKLQKLQVDTLQNLPDSANFTEEFIDTMDFYFGEYVRLYYNGQTTDNRNAPDDYIDFIADLNDFTGEIPYGLTLSSPQITYGYTGSKPFKQITKSEATDIYRQVLYPNVLNLPAEIRHIALDIHAIQGDHIGLVMATAERMGVNIPYDYDAVTDIWFGFNSPPVPPQIINGYPTNYKNTFLYQEYPKYKADIEALIAQDSEKFIIELSKTRLMRDSILANTTLVEYQIGNTADDTKFLLYAYNTFAMMQYAIDYNKNNVEQDSYYLSSSSQFYLLAKDYAFNLDNANDSDFTDDWYRRVRIEYEQKVLIKRENKQVGTGLEFNLNKYCQIAKNRINPNSTRYQEFKVAYKNILNEIKFSVNVMVVNIQKILNPNGNLYASFNISTLSEADLRTYLRKWLESFRKYYKPRQNQNLGGSTGNISLTEEQEFYLNDKDIKIATYRYYKNLYDKWLAGSKNEQLHNTCQCGSKSPRNSMLIDRFHFVDRAWNYLGDRAVLNPRSLMNYLESPDISLYEYLGNILRDSNFDFHVLPSWVNYRNVEEIKEMWKPTLDVDDANEGASYICMYMGGTSKVLDLGENSKYVNDGFDLREFDTNIPKQFKDRRTPEYIQNLEDSEKFKYNMVAFRVAYSDPNQSIFKNVGWTQEEFQETAESLQAVSDAFDNRGGSKRMYKNTNLYNIYSIRSYKAKINCMGNMLIHPLTYFQLDNTPYFHGAYLITKVSHSITSHYVDTNFEGVRVPRYIAPVIEEATTFINIPLDETLFTSEQLDDPIVRPLNAEDPDNLISVGEDVISENSGDGIPTATEVTSTVDSDNVLFEVNFVNTNQEFKFFIKDDLNLDNIDERFNTFFNPNSPTNIKNVGLGYCAKWVKRIANKFGILQQPFGGIDAWTFFSGVEEAGVRYISEQAFVNGIENGWTNEALTNEVPDGSYIFCYYPTSSYKERSIDRMVKTGLSSTKLSQLEKYLNLDTTTKNFKFTKAGYLNKTSRSEATTFAENLYGKQLPFLPATHIGIFANGHLFHQLKKVETAPTRSLRIFAYFPFKDLLKQKIAIRDGVTPPNSNNQSSFFNFNNFFNF